MVEISRVGRANLEAVLPKLGVDSAQTEPALPLLRGANVTITQAGDIEKLAAQLAAETNDKASSVAKTAVSSSYAAVLARVMEMQTVDEDNMRVLDEAKEIGDEIDALDVEAKEIQQEIDTLTDKLHREEREVNGLKKEESSLKKQAADLDKQIAELDKQIATTTDPAKKQELLAKKAELQASLVEVRKDLAATSSKLAAAQASMAATQKAIGDAAQKMAETMSQKDVKKEALKKKLEELKDKELLQSIIDMLKQDKADVSRLVEEKEVERSDEEEKYLEEHSPVKIIQEMLDDISERMEEKI